jgi:hypothetical protein
VQFICLLTILHMYTSLQPWCAFVVHGRVKVVAPIRLHGAPLSEVWEGAKILVVCQNFCPKYFVCKFLHLSASNLN